MRPSTGYGTYELCSGTCSGSVPSSLRRALGLPHASGSGCPASRPQGPVRALGGAQLTVERFIGEGHVPYDELQLLDSGQGVTPARGEREWLTFTRVRGPACYAYQVDGTSFSEVLVFRAVG